jgi:ribulose-5-phosphate 4-epimerase/fuculose-1-phosphate aldolase
LVAWGLNKGTSGNCSVRHGKSHFLITPSGVSVIELPPNQLSL